jgi:dTDP-4-dehydrorhamnose 3,5-epimerase-like enzyme
MKKESKKKNHEDARGFIQDIAVDIPFEHATFIFSKKNIIRGNHYHKLTVQYVFVLEGQLEYHYVDPNGNRGVVVLKPGDLIETPAFEKHAIKTVEDTKMIVLTRGPRGGENYENDTFRLEEPILRGP